MHHLVINKGLGILLCLAPTSFKPYYLDLTNIFPSSYQYVLQMSKVMHGHVFFFNSHISSYVLHWGI
jgi:hypothetical protein